MSFVSKSPTAKLLAHAYEGRVERFLKFKILSIDAVVALTDGSESEAEKMCKKIFCYGWLSPDGTFIEVPFAEHVKTVERITGHKDCDTACEQGWIKFTCGLPYNHEGECLFESGSDKTKLNSLQKAWLNTWLAAVAEVDEENRAF